MPKFSIPLPTNHKGLSMYRKGAGSSVAAMRNILTPLQVTLPLEPVWLNIPLPFRDRMQLSFCEGKFALLLEVYQFKYYSHLTNLKERPRVVLYHYLGTLDQKSNIILNANVYICMNKKRTNLIQC